MSISFHELPLTIAQKNALKNEMAINIEKTQQENANIAKALKLALKKKEIWGKISNGITRALAEKETVLQNYKNTTVASADDVAQVEEKWATIADLQNDIAAKLEPLDERLLFKQYLKLKQNEALILCWQDLILEF
jgi:hypothetical protein